MRLSALVLLAISACTGAQITDQPYYTMRDRFSSSVDTGADYARWCADQPDRRECGFVVVETFSLETKARAAVLNSNGRRDAGDKAGASLADLAARATVDRLSEYVTAHPINAKE